MHETHKIIAWTIRKFNDFLKYDDLSVVATLLGLWFNQMQIFPALPIFSVTLETTNICISNEPTTLVLKSLIFFLMLNVIFKIYSKTKRNAGKGHKSNTINLKLMIKRFVMLMIHQYHYITSNVYNT